MLKAVVAAGDHGLFAYLSLAATASLQSFRVLYFRAVHCRAEHLREDGKQQGGSLPIAVSAGWVRSQRIT